MRALLVEERQGVRAVLVGILEIAGYQVYEAADYPAGLAAWHRGGWNAVVVDATLAGGGEAGGTSWRAFDPVYGQSGHDGDAR